MRHLHMTGLAVAASFCGRQANAEELTKNPARSRLLDRNEMQAQCGPRSRSYCSQNRPRNFRARHATCLVLGMDIK